MWIGPLVRYWMSETSEDIDNLIVVFNVKYVYTFYQILLSLYFIINSGN